MSNIYVAKTGSNINTGSTPELSVLTISQAINLANSGDIIYIQEGIYPEYLEITKSGITLLPYQNQKVTITAYDLIPNSLWKEHEVGIYKAVLDSSWDIGLGRNDVFNTEDSLQEARWPKLTNRLDVKRDTCAISREGDVISSSPIDAEGNYLGYYTHSGLGNLTNITGARVYMTPGYEWWTRAGEVVSHTGERIDIKYKYSGWNDSNTDKLSADDPFFIWNKYELLTQEGDYFFDTTTEVLYIRSVVFPSDIYMRKRDIVVDIKTSDVVIKSLNIKGRIETSSTSSNVKLEGLDISRGYKNSLLTINKAAIELKGDGNRVNNCHIYDTGCAFISIYGRNQVVENNVMHNDGYAGSLSGCQSISTTNLRFTRNTVYNTAAMAVSIMGIASEYSYNHIYNVGTFLTDLAAMNAWNSGDGQGTVVKWNHIHDTVAYYNPIGNHWGGKGIRLDSGGALLGCSNYKIHNNLIYRLSNNAIALFALEPSQLRYGDALTYVVNNTTDGMIRIKNSTLGPEGCRGIYIQNNLALNYEQSLGSNIPNGLVINNNFITNKAILNNLTGYADIKNWIPNPTSPLNKSGVTVPGINNSLTPDIGWLGNNERFVWGGATETDIQNLDFRYDRYLKRLIIHSLIPGRSLSESTQIRVNGVNIYLPIGRKIEDNHSLTHLFNPIESGELSIEISFDGGLTYQLLGNVEKPSLVINEVYVENNEIVIRGKNYFTNSVNIIDITYESLTLSQGYTIVPFDTSSIPFEDLDSIRVINRFNTKSLSYYLEDIKTTNRRYTPLHLRLNEVDLSEEGKLEIRIEYGGGRILPQPEFKDINPEVSSYIYSGEDLMWLKSHSCNVENNQPVTSWSSYNGVKDPFTQTNTLYQPSYEESSLNGWPGVRFDVDSLVGPDLGVGKNFTIVALYKSEENPGVNYPRVLSGGIDSGNDWEDGVRLLPTLENLSQVPGVEVKDLTFTQRNLNRVTLGSYYKEASRNNYKGKIYEVIVMPGVILSTLTRSQIKNYLRIKYGISPQPSISSITYSNPLNIQLGTEIYDSSSIRLINEEEVRIPYKGEIGNYPLTITNPNNELYVTQIELKPDISFMEVTSDTSSFTSGDTWHWADSARTQTLTIRNKSLVDTLLFSNVNISGEYSLLNIFPSELSSNASFNLTLELNSNIEGIYLGSLSFEVNQNLFTLNLNAHLMTTSKIFYVSKTGTDTNGGQNLNDALLTINKAVSLSSAGDTIYICEGYYSEFISISKSNLTILPYQNQRVIISAYDLIPSSSWVLHETGVYKAVLDSTWDIGLGRNDVYSPIDELQEARWPKVANRLDVRRDTCAISTDGSTNITTPIDASNNYLGYYIHPQLSQLPNMTGAWVYMVPGYEWWIRAGEIVSHTGERIDIKYKYSGFYNPEVDRLAKDDPFFIWNKYELMTEKGDYYFDINTDVLYIKSEVKPLDVYMRKRDRVIAITGADIKIEGIKIMGRVETTDTSSNMEMIRVDIERGHKDRALRGGYGALDLRGNGHKVKESHIYDTGGAFMNIRGSNHIIQSNVFNNDGYAGESTGVQTWGAVGVVFTRNTIYETVSLAISVLGIASEYSYNHTYQIGRLTTDLAAINAWNSGDTQGTVIKWNHVHDVVAYSNPIGSHNGGKGIRLDGGGSPKGCSNFKIHNNLCYRVTNYSYALWRIEEQQERYGDAQIYFVNNTGDNNFLLFSTGVGPLGFNGVYCHNNLVLDMVNNLDSNIPTGISFTDNFLTRRQLPNNYQGYAKLKNWIPQEGSPLIDKGIVVPGITNTPNPDIGWMEAGQSIVWGGAIELLTSNVEVQYNQPYSKLVIETKVPGRSLPEDTLIRINEANTYSIYGRTLNPNHTVNHFFDITENGESSLEISFNNGISFEYLTTIYISRLYNTQIYKEGNELVIKGGGYFTQTNNTLDIKVNSLSPCGNYVVLRVDTSSIPQQDLSTLRVRNKADGSEISYWLEDIEVTDRRNTPLHLKMNELQLTPDGGVEIEIAYGGEIINQPTLMEINRQVGELIDKGNPVLWYKSHMIRGEEGQLTQEWKNYDLQGYSLSQGTVERRPKYEVNSLNGWPGVKFNTSSLKGTDLGNGDYTLLALYKGEENPTVTYPRLISGGIPEGQDYINGIQLLPSLNTNNLQIATVDVARMNYASRDFNSITIGSSYKNPLGSNFKGSIYEVIILKGVRLLTPDLLTLREYLRVKYGIYPQPTVDVYNTSSPLTVKFGTSIYTTDDDLSLIQNNEIRVPYQQEKGTYELIVTNPNKETASIYITFSYMEILHNNISISPSSTINYPSVFINEPHIETFIIKNNSEVDTLTLDSLLVPLGFSLVGSFPLSLTPLSEIPFSIQLDASQAGLFSGVLSFNTSDIDIPIVSISLNGEVLEALIEVTSNTSTPLALNSTLYFDEVTQGDISNNSFTVLSTGTSNLIIDNLTLTNPEFSITNPLTLPLVIGSNSSETINVSLDTSIIGSKEGTLSFTTNDINYPIYSFNLSALVNEIAKPLLEVFYSGVSLLEGQVISLGSTSISNPLSFTLDFKNIGNALLTPSNITVPTGYSLTSPITSIPPGDSLPISIQLDATSKGTFSGLISITYNPTITFGITGKVLAPILLVSHNSTPILPSYALNFPSSSVNSISPEEIILIENQGDSVLTISSISISSPFSLPSLTFPIDIVPGQSIPIIISLNPSISGSYTSEIVISSNDTSYPSFSLSAQATITSPTLSLSYLAQPLSPNQEIDYLRVARGEVSPIKSLTILNEGEEDLVISSIDIPLGFSISSIPLPLVIPPSNTFELPIELDTQEMGTYEGDLIFNSNDEINPEYPIKLKGIIEAPRIEISNVVLPLPPLSTLDYGSIELNRTVETKVLTISNTGNIPLNVLDIIVSPSFALSPLTLPLIIPPASSQDIGVTLISTNQAGEVNSTLEVVSDDTIHSPYSINLKALITAPTIEVSHTSVIINPLYLIDFGIKELNSTQGVRESISISNKGNQDLIVFSINTSEGYYTEPNSFPYTISPSENLNLDIVLNTAIPGNYIGSVEISSNDSSQSIFRIETQGVITGAKIEIRYKGIPIEPNGWIDFLSNKEGEVKEEVIEIINTGNEELIISEVVTSNPFSTQTVSPLSVLPQESINLALIFNSNRDTSIGEHLGNITLSTNAFEGQEYQFNLKATITPSPVLSVRYLNEDKAPLSVLDFGSITKGTDIPLNLIELENIGSEDLVITSIVLPPGFFLNPPVFYPITLTPSSKLGINLDIDTSTVGIQEGDLIIESNDETNASYPLHLKTSIVIPKIELTLNNETLINASNLISEFNLNSNPILPLVINNKGEGDLLINNISLPLGYSLLTPISNYPFTLLPSQQLPLDIVIASDRVNTYGGDLRIETNDETHPVFTIHLLHDILGPIIEVRKNGELVLNTSQLIFENHSINTPVVKTLLITNKGNEAITLDRLVLPLGYSSVSLLSPLSLAINESTELEIVSQSSEPGSFSGRLEIYIPEMIEPIYILDLTTVITSALIEVSQNGMILSTGDTLLFEEQTEGLPANGKTIIISNPGEDSLLISEVTISNPWSINPPLLLPIEIASNETREIAINVDTSLSGVYDTPLVFTTNAYNEPNYELKLYVRVITPPPVLEVVYNQTPLLPDEGVIDFGSLTIGSESLRNFSFNNKGGGELIINTLSLPNGYQFNPEITFPLVIKESLTIGISMDTTVPHVYEGLVFIGSNDILNSPFIFLMTGEVLGSSIKLIDESNNSPLANEDSLTFGSLEEKTTLDNTRSILITNEGNQPLTLNSIELPPGYSLSPSLIYPYEVLDDLALTIILDTNTPGEYNGSLVINSDAYIDSSLSLNLTATITPLQPLIEITHLTTPIISGYILDYGQKEQGQEINQSLVITNKGKGGLLITQLISSYPYDLTLNSSILDLNFLTPFNPLTVIPNETVEVFISLVDNTLGLKEGKITINTNDINSSVIEILVKGQIVEVPYAKLTVSKTGEILSNGSYIDIGKTKENVPNEIILSLTNDGIKDLEISSIVLPEGIISDLFTPVSLIPSEVLFITLGLDGQGIGIKEGIVEILTNDESSPFTLNIYGEVEGTPLLSITSDTGEMIQSPIDIGLVEYNSTISKALILKNEGTGVLVIDSFTSTSPSLSLPNLSLPLSLLPNEQAEIILQVEASTPELYEETISLNTNLDFNPLVELTIIGQVFTNNLVVLYNQSLLQIGDIITFDERVVPESSILSLILKNEGQVDITLNDWLITPPFSYLLTPPSQLRVGETKEVSLKLESTVANLYEGTLSFHLGDSQSTLYNYSLIGNLLSPYYELSIFNNQLPLTPGSTLSFGVTPDGVPTTEVITLRNTGNTPYDLTSITLPPGYSSTFSSPITIPVLGEVNIEVQLLEEVPGIYEGQLSLDGSREFTINLSGEVYLVLEPKLEVLIEGQPLPDSIDYGSTPLNESLIQTLTINNSGNGDLIIDSISLPPGYTYLGTLPLIIPPSSSSTLELQFNATQQGITQGLVELHTNQVDTPVISFEVKAEVLVGELSIDIDNSPLYPTNLIQFGSNYTPISKLLTLSNIGTAPITIYSISVPLGFSYIPSIPLTIDIGSSISLSISLDAIEAGEYLGQLIIDSNAINSSFILYLEGIMNEIPYTLLQVHASGVLIESRWDIGKIEKGELISKEVVLSNLGNEELSLSNIEIGEGVYRLVYPSLPLVLGQPITVNLEIYSEELGIFESQWRLIDSEGKVYQIDLNVEVEAGILSVVQFSTPLTPDSLIDMGINYLNQSFIPVNLTLSNIGNIPLLDLTSTHSSPLFSSTPIIPNSLQPNASIGTTINFLPLSQGVHTSLLTFLGSDKPSSSESLFTLNLKGEALAPLNSYIQIDPMEGIAIPLNGTADILIKNNSEYPIVIKELTGGIPGVSSISALPITIAPGESISLPITYRTNETPVEGEVSINIELESNIGDNTGIDNIEVKGFLVPRLPQNIGLGATDTLRIIGEYPEGIVITKIPEGIVIKLGDTEVVEGQTISEDQIGNLKVFSINPGIYTIEYSSGSNPYSLDLQVESLPLTTNETGYIPIPRYDGLYPTSPYWIEGDTYWVLVEEGMTLTSTPTEPSSLPANLVFDVVSKDDEPDWRNNKPLTVVNEETQELNVLIVGTIDKGDFDTASMSRDIFINYSTLPDTILSINEVILTNNSITIQGIVYTLSLEAGVIRFSMTPNSIKVINNGVVKRNISSTYLWLPRGSIYSLDVTDNNLMTELIVSVDEASILINTYMTRKYIEKGEYISLLTV